MGAKQNRKKRRTTTGVAAPFTVLLSTGALLALSYLWLCGRCETLGRRIKSLEERQAEVHKRVVTEQFKWSNAKSPGNLEQLLQRHRLAMSLPDEGRVMRVRRRGDEFAAEKSPAGQPQFAQHAGTVVND